MHPDLLPSHPTRDLRDFFFLPFLVQTSLLRFTEKTPLPNAEGMRGEVMTK